MKMHEQNGHQMSKPKHPWLIVIGTFIFFFLMVYIEKLFREIEFR